MHEQRNPGKSFVLCAYFGESRAAQTKRVAVPTENREFSPNGVEAILGVSRSLVIHRLNDNDLSSAIPELRLVREGKLGAKRAALDALVEETKVLMRNLANCYRRPLKRRNDNTAKDGTLAPLGHTKNQRGSGKNGKRTLTNDIHNATNRQRFSLPSQPDNIGSTVD